MEVVIDCCVVTVFIADNRHVCCRVVDLVSPPSSIVVRSTTMTHASVPAKRFHSVRKVLSYDVTNAHTCSTDSGLFVDDDVEIYSNWSSRRLSDIQDLTVSDEDISANNSWVSYSWVNVLLHSVQWFGCIWLALCVYWSSKIIEISWHSTTLLQKQKRCSFYHTTHMHCADSAVTRYLSILLSVCPSVRLSQHHWPLNISSKSFHVR